MRDDDLTGTDTPDRGDGDDHPEVDAGASDSPQDPWMERGAAALGETMRPEEEARLLRFYDRLRRRILKAVERRGGKLGAATVRVLLLVPDIFLLLVRLLLDRDVPKPARAMIGTTLAYFVLPFDLLPEAMLGPAGFLDDVVLATAVLSQVFGGELEPYARKHWSGPEELRLVVREILDSARSILGDRSYQRLQALLAKRGIKI